MHVVGFALFPVPVPEDKRQTTRAREQKIKGAFCIVFNVRVYNIALARCS